MRGTWRIRKKHLTQTGWQIREEEGGHRLVLQKPDAEPVTIAAPTRPRAYFQAEHKVIEKSKWLLS